MQLFFPKYLLDLSKNGNSINMKMIKQHPTNVSCTDLGPNVMAVWSEALPRAVRFLSPLPWFEYRPRYVRKIPVTGG